MVSVTDILLLSFPWFTLTAEQLPMSINTDPTSPLEKAAASSAPYPMSQLVLGSRWQHKNLEVYEIIALANIEGTKPDYPTTVVYRNIKTERIYARQYVRFTPSSFQPVES